MKLRFDPERIRELAGRYDAETRERDRRLTTAITKEVFPSYKQKGHLTKDEFRTVCEWKTPRSKRWCESNDEDLIKEVSALALATKSERLRIQVWTLLAGVQWPTASVFLHFAFHDRYPIIDYRAIWSLQADVPNQYTFPFWWEYTSLCRTLAREARVTMRALDKALWKYSELHQP